MDMLVFDSNLKDIKEEKPVSSVGGWLYKYCTGTLLLFDEWIETQSTVFLIVFFSMMLGSLCVVTLCF